MVRLGNSMECTNRRRQIVFAGFLPRLCLLVGCMLVACAAKGSYASGAVDWRDVAVDPGGEWLVATGVDPLGQSVAITAVASRGDREVRFLTTYLGGDTDLVIRRDVRSDGTFAVSYALGTARLSLAGMVQDGSSFVDLRFDAGGETLQRRTRLATETSGAEIVALRTDLDQARRPGSGDFGPRAEEMDRLLTGIERYLADIREVPAAVPRLGDVIVGALLPSAAPPSRVGESLEPGGGRTAPVNTLRTVLEPCRGLGCRDCCAGECDDQCAFECAISGFPCRICMTACAIGCAIGCG